MATVMALCGYGNALARQCGIWFAPRRRADIVLARELARTSRATRSIAQRRRDETDMTKGEAERGIRYLCGEWAKLRGIVRDPTVQPSFVDFLSWVRDKYPAYLQFRSRIPVPDVVEGWFDEEFGQTWRN